MPGSKLNLSNITLLVLFSIVYHILWPTIFILPFFHIVLDILFLIFLHLLHQLFILLVCAVIFDGLVKIVDVSVCIEVVHFHFFLVFCLLCNMNRLHDNIRSSDVGF